MARKTRRMTALVVSPQEQCLRNSDLLDQILRLLAPLDEPPQDLRVARNNLYRAALTSRAFSFSAIKLLWQRLDNLLPLIRLLPFKHSGRVYVGLP
ncbi:hypothetical protein B0H19DRAFT_82069 [Mycena capillaripes]|nr:hypothetical protein B0H19DRAFT_82069 [Mycena capillaripes]